jgi:hypothetical protein
MSDQEKIQAEEILCSNISTSTIEYYATDACYKAFQSEFTAAMADVESEEEREYLYSRFPNIRTEILSQLNI